MLSHQNSHGVSHQTARSDLRKLAGRGLLIPSKEGRRDIFRVPEDLPDRRSWMIVSSLRLGQDLRGEETTGEFAVPFTIFHQLLDDLAVMISL